MFKTVLLVCSFVLLPVARADFEQASSKGQENGRRSGNKKTKPNKNPPGKVDVDLPPLPDEAVAPEPMYIVLLGAGLAGLAVAVRRRRKNGQHPE